MNLYARTAVFLWQYTWVRRLVGLIRGRVVVSDFEGIKGMTTLEERDSYYQLVKSGIGNGQIVDLGCWFGSTTLPLLKALNDRQSNQTGNIKVFAFDRFIWEKEMQDVVRWFPELPPISVGSNFKAHMEANIKPYAHLAHVEEVDLLTYQWKDGAIELLLVDAMKSLPLTITIARNFLPSVVAGNGIIVFQDFAHYYTSWLHILTYELRHILQPMYNVPHSGTMVFKVLKEITTEDLDFLNRMDSLEAEYIKRVFDYSISLARNENKHRVIAAKAMCFVHYRNLSEGRRIYAEEIAPKYKRDEEVLLLRDYMKQFD